MCIRDRCKAIKIHFTDLAVQDSPHQGKQVAPPNSGHQINYVGIEYWFIPALDRTVRTRIGIPERCGNRK